MGDSERIKKASGYINRAITELGAVKRESFKNVKINLNQAADLLESYILISSICEEDK